MALLSLPGSKPRVGRVIDESTCSPTFYGSTAGFKVPPAKLKRSDFWAPQKFKKSDTQTKEKAFLKIRGNKSLPGSGFLLRRRSTAAPCKLDPKPPPTLDPTPQPPILSPKPIPPALQVEPNFYNSLSNRSLTVLSKQARMPALPSMKTSRSYDELQPELKSTRPVSWRSCPLPVHRVTKKRVPSPPSDPFVSIICYKSQPPLGEENDMNVDLPLQGKLLLSEESEKSARG